jgi:predicted porin
LWEKSTLVALAVLAVSGAAFAQSTVTLSGSINTGIVNTGAASAKAVVGSLGNGANAINLASTEDLGGGLKGGFTGQIRYTATGGDVNSAGTSAGSSLFHAANAFVSGGFGTIRVGKIAEAGNCGLDPWGCTGGAGLSAAAGNAAAGVIGRTAGAAVTGLIGAGTQASSVSFTTPNINGFTASYQTTMTTRVNERSVVNLTYAKGPLSLQFLQTENSGNAAINATLGIPNAVADANGKGTSIGGSYNFGVATLSVWNAKTTAATTNTATATVAATAHAAALGGANIDRDVTAVGVTMPMGAYTLLAGYAKDKKQIAARDTRLAAGVSYALSKRTTIGADVFKDENLWDAKGAAGTGFVLRVGHTF